MKIGDIVKGKVTGIKPYGAFVKFEDESTGLIHISEISNGFVKDINNFVKLNEMLEVKVIDVDEENNQYRLSLKALNDKKRNKRRVRYQPLQMKIGFKTIEEKMDEWITEINKEIEND